MAPDSKSPSQISPPSCKPTAQWLCSLEPCAGLCTLGCSQACLCRAVDVSCLNSPRHPSCSHLGCLALMSKDSFLPHHEGCCPCPGTLCLCTSVCVHPCAFSCVPWVWLSSFLPSLESGHCFGGQTLQYPQGFYQLRLTLPSSQCLHPPFPDGIGYAGLQPAPSQHPSSSPGMTCTTGASWQVNGNR